LGDNVVMAAMRIRLLTKDDLEIVRKLRNGSRHAFFDDREISEEQQAQWFERLPGRPVSFFVIEVDGRVVGTISVSETPHGREIGNLVLDHAYRGQGIMRRAVEQLTKEPGTYFADVKKTNEPSLRVFASTGFDETVIRLFKQVK
jgi:RimJ/RimL family protein N-acetyltransferase